MKILFFASDYKIGLSDLLVEELNFLFKQPELEIIAIAGEYEQSLGLSQRLDDNKIPIIKLTGLDEHRNFVSLAGKIREIIIEKQCEIVHVQNNWQLSLLIFIKIIKRIDFKIVYTIHGFRHNQYFKSLIAKTLIDFVLFVFADIVFAPSSVVKSKFHFTKKKCHILFLGVEERYFNVALPQFSEEHKNFIFAGQFRQGKNQSMIIDAVSLFIKKTGRSNFTFYLPGEGPFKDQCIHQVQALNLQENIIIPGHLSRDEIFDLYCRCHFAVIPSNSETFGHCIAEPFVLGLCVISRAVGIAKDIIDHGRTGLLFKNAIDLAILLENYLDNNDMLDRFGNESYKIRDILRWNKICSNYKKFLASLPA